MRLTLCRLGEHLAAPAFFFGDLFLAAIFLPYLGALFIVSAHLLEK